MPATSRFTPLLAAALGLASFASAAPVGLAAPAGWLPVASLIPRPPVIGRKRPAPAARPAAKPSVRPAAKPTPRPAATARPAARPAQPPVAAPSAAPTPAPVASTAAIVPSPAAAVPLLSASGRVATWVLPLSAGAGYDFSFARPTWLAEGAAWWGDWGALGAVTVFNTTYAAFRTAPYFQANTPMIDALVARRFDNGRYTAFGGYRGLGMADVNYATAGAGLHWPLTSDWLFLDGRAQVGLGLSGGFLVDGRLGLSVDLDPLVLDLAFRQLSLQAAADPVFTLNGPVASIGLRF